jgi:hypothetical protein
MRILPFRKPLGASEQARLNDWTQQEMADFYRAHRLLVENGVGIGIDRGLSDAGDPWLAFYDEATQEVFLHIARIDQACVLVCDQLELRITASTIGELISIFETEVRRIISLRQERNSKVILHPAARIIMSISAVFLLFKLENNAAHAKEAAGSESESVALRKQEMAANARAQSALGRLYEMVDTPVAVAALAGLLISLELASSGTRITSPESDAVQKLSGLKALDHHETHETELMGAEHDAAILPVAFFEPEPVEIPEEMLELIVTVPLEVEASFEETADSLPTEAAPQRVLASLNTLTLDALSIAVAAQPVGEEQKSASKSASGEASSSVLAIKIVETILAGLESAEDAAKALTVKPKGGIGEITLANLEGLSGTVATFLETEVSGSLLTAALVHFLQSITEYEFEYAGSLVLIEQKHVAGLDEELVGIWKNTLEDGSIISVVGHVELIDHVASMVA